MIRFTKNVVGLFLGIIVTLAVGPFVLLYLGVRALSRKYRCTS